VPEKLKHNLIGIALLGSLLRTQTQSTLLNPDLILHGGKTRGTILAATFKPTVNCF
jgi:hypothetical protein